MVVGNLGKKCGAVRKYRYGLKGWPVLQSTSWAGPDRNFSQPRAHLLVHFSISEIIRSAYFAEKHRKKFAFARGKKVLQRRLISLSMFLWQIKALFLIRHAQSLLLPWQNAKSWCGIRQLYPEQSRKKKSQVTPLMHINKRRPSWWKKKPVHSQIQILF